MSVTAPPDTPDSVRNLLIPAPRPRAVRARHAASLLVVSPGPRVLMGMRGAKHRFMPNRLVFPGGAVEPADARAPAATPLDAETRRHLEKAANPRLAHGIAHAAARELEEETGLSLGTPPQLDALRYLCRAVTPAASPMRFNARFLTVEAARVSGTLAGSGELENLREYDVEEALALDLAWVTRHVLLHLKAWLAMSELERATRIHTPVCKTRNWRVE